MGEARKIGLIAGGRSLPVYVAQAVKERGEGLTIIEIDPDCPPGRFGSAHRLPLTKFGKILKTFENEKVTHICMAGHVARPDFARFRPDMSAMRYLPGTVLAAKEGDDALMRHVMGIFESKGFKIVSAQSLCDSLLVDSGTLGLHAIAPDQRADAQRAMEIADLIGDKDIGQGAVVADGVVLAVEAQEGTDAMLERVASLPAALRGDEIKRLGVLAKRPKPNQDKRVDLPTIGPRTVELAAAAGLAGIIVDAGEAFIIDREQTIALADQHGMFLIGLPKTSDRDPA